MVVCLVAVLALSAGCDTDNYEDDREQFASVDTEGDGEAGAIDAFPGDPSETTDNDGDGRGKKAMVTGEPPTPAEQRAAMTWAQRLKRVFNIDIETCSACGGATKVIACIEDPIVIKQILDHLEHKAGASEPRALPESRAPPVGLQSGLFD